MITTTSFRSKALALVIAGSLALAPLSGCAAFSHATSTQSNEAKTSTETEYYADAAEGSGYYAMTDSSTMYYEPDVPFNTEEYAAIDETGFISTLTRPLSTVSADVDTASWCNLRRMVRDGYVLAGTDVDEDGNSDEYYYDYGTIPAGAVRIEEMLNYFGYDYEKPAAGDDFAVTARMGTCPWNEKTDLLVLGFSTADEDTASEKGRNLVFLIDVSGSMDSPDKLYLLQDSFAGLVEQLGPNDRVSIVTYASGEELVLDGVAGDRDREILRAINRLRADGSTNGERGLELAYEVAEKHFIEGGVNRIIMASDGDLNVGMTSESDLHDYVSKKRETGVYLSVLGFGSGNYKDTKMETLADDGNGQYHYIDCEEAALRVFGDKLCANLVPFADDVKFQIEFNPAQVKGYRLIGYENRALADEDFRDDSVDAGDVGPEAQFTVAYEIVPADSDFEVAGSDLKYQETTYSGSDEWLTCTLRWHSFADGEYHEMASTVDESTWAAAPGSDWNFQAAIIELGMLMRGSEYAGNTSFENIYQLAEQGPEDAERDGFVELVRELEDNSDLTDWSTIVEE